MYGGARDGNCAGPLHEGGPTMGKRLLINNTEFGNQTPTTLTNGSLIFRTKMMNSQSWSLGRGTMLLSKMG